MKLANKYLKQQHDIMLSFGYELVRWSKRTGGHPIYERAGWPRLELSSTPRSEKAARARLLRELRKRHPEHPMWRSMRHRSPRRRRKARGSARQPLSLRIAGSEQPAEPAVLEAPPVQRAALGVSPIAAESWGCGRCKTVVRPDTHRYWENVASIRAHEVCERCWDDRVYWQRSAAA